MSEEKRYEEGLYRRYVVNEGNPLDPVHSSNWHEYDRAPDAERAVAAWEKVRESTDSGSLRVFAHGVEGGWLTGLARRNTAQWLRDIAAILEREAADAMA